MLCAISAAAPTLAADAEIRGYGNIGFHKVNAPQNLDFNAVVLRGGARYGRHIGAEFEGVIGLGADTVSAGGFGIRTDLRHSVAGYAVVAYPATDKIEVFGRAGYVNVRLSADAGFGRVTDSDSGFAGGVGAQYFFGSGKNGVRFDYTRFELGGATGGFDNIALSFVRRF